MTTVQIVLIALGLYSIAGIAFAVFFFARGARVIDPATSGSSIGFLAVTMPGVVALWPVLLVRVLGSKKRVGLENEPNAGDAS